MICVRISFRSDTASFFESSVNCIVHAIAEQLQKGRKPIKRTSFDPADADLCFHFVTTPHNYRRIFSSPAPGFAMNVGSIGESLSPYEESETSITTDAGATWQMASQDALKYEFGDKGSILVVVNDEDGMDSVRYSLELSKSW